MLCSPPRSSGPSSRLAAVACIALAGVAGTASAAAPGQDGDAPAAIEEQLVLVYRDGRVEQLRLDAAGDARDVVASRSAGGARRAADQLTLVRAFLWKPGTKFVKFNNTPFGKAFRKALKKTQAVYHNKRRGNGNVPRFKMTTAEDAVAEPSAFGSYTAFFNQFRADGKNTVVIDAQDRFFKDAAGKLLDDDLMAYSYTRGTASFVNVGGRFVGTTYWQEADVYVRSDLFALSRFLQRLIAIASFRYTLGYAPTVWPLDLHAADPAHLTEADFENKASSTWKDFAAAWDDFHYRDALVGPEARAAFLDEPRVLPVDGALINLGNYRPPQEVDLGAVRTTQTVFLTNLKGFDGDKVMSLAFTHLQGTTRKSLFTLSSNADGWPLEPGSGLMLYPTIFFQRVHIDDTPQLTQLRDLIAKQGTPMTVDGVEYARAIRVEIEFSGRLQEDGGLRSATRTYVFVDVPHAGTGAS